MARQVERRGIWRCLDSILVSNPHMTTSMVVSAHICKMSALAKIENMTVYQCPAAWTFSAPGVRAKWA